MKTGKSTSMRFGNRLLAMLCALLLVATMLPMYVIAADIKGGLYEGWKHISYDYFDLKENTSDYISYDTNTHSITVDAMESEGEFLYLNRKTADDLNSGDFNLQQFAAEDMTNFVIEFDVKLNDFADKDYVNSGIPGAVSPAGIGLSFLADKPNSLHTANIMARLDYVNAGFLMYDWPANSSVGYPYKDHFNYVGNYTGVKGEPTNVVQYHWMYNYAAQPHIKVTKVGDYIRMEITNTTANKPYVIDATLAEQFPDTGYIGLVVENASATFSNVSVVSYADGATVDTETGAVTGAVRAECRYFTAPGSLSNYYTYGLYEGWRAASVNAGAESVVSYNSNTHAIAINALNRGTHSLYLNRALHEKDLSSSTANINRFGADSMTDFEISFDLVLETDAENNGYISVALLDNSYGSFDDDALLARIDDHGVFYYVGNTMINGFGWPAAPNGGYLNYFKGSVLPFVVRKNGNVVGISVNNSSFIQIDITNPNLAPYDLSDAAGYVGFFADSLNAIVSNVVVTNTATGESATFFSPNSEGSLYGDQVEGWQHVSDVASNSHSDEIIYNVDGTHSVRINAADAVQNLYLNRNAAYGANSADENCTMFPYDVMEDFTVTYDVTVNKIGAVSLAFLGTHDNRLDVHSITARIDESNIGFMWRNYTDISMPDAYQPYNYVDFNQAGVNHIAPSAGYMVEGNTLRITVVKDGINLTMNVMNLDTGAALSAPIAVTLDEAADILPKTGYVGIMVENADVTIRNMSITNDTAAGEPVSYFTSDLTNHVHIWNDANCDAPEYCDGCGAAQGTALGHVWVGAGINAKCQRCAKSQCEANGHTPMLVPSVTPTTTKVGWTAGSKCSVCNETIIPQAKLDALTEANSSITALIGFDEGDALSHIVSTSGQTRFEIVDSGVVGSYGEGGKAMQANPASSKPYITLYRAPQAETNAIAFKVNMSTSSTWIPVLVEAGNASIDGDRNILSAGTAIEVHRPYTDPKAYANSACIYLKAEDGTITELDLADLYDPHNPLANGFTGWVVYPLDVFQEQETFVGEPDSGLNISNVTQIMIEYAATASFTIDTIVAVENANQFLGNMNLCETHTWNITDCSKPAVCSTCGTVNGIISHKWNGAACELCHVSLFEVAEDFSEVNMLESNDKNYHAIHCTTPFGRALNYFRTVESKNKAPIKFTLDAEGEAEDQALVFWFDASDSGWRSDANIEVRLFTDDSQIFFRNVEDFVYTYYMVINGVTTKRTASEPSKVAVPQDASGWIILPLPAKYGITTKSGEKTTFGGTLEGVNAMSLFYDSYNYASLVVDQVGFIKDVDAFAALAAQGNANIPGYAAPQGHNYNAEHVCTVCGEALFELREDFTNFDGSYMGGTTASVYQHPFGNTAVFTYNEEQASKEFDRYADSYDFISFGDYGDGNDKAIAFYYNASFATKNVRLRFAPATENGSSYTTLKQGYPVTSIIDGVVKVDDTSLFTSNAHITLPAGTSGWIIIDMRAGSHWGLFGEGPHSTQMIAGVGLAIETKDASVALDQFGFVTNVTDFADWAQDNANMPGYEVVPFHTWENGVCRYCGMEQLLDFLGTSVNDKENALRFGFTLKADGIAVENYQRDLTNATVTIKGVEYKLVEFGAIITNKTGLKLSMADVDDKRTKKIEAKVLYDWDEESGIAVFTCGIKGIPAQNKGSILSARAYFIFEDAEGNLITVYSDLYQQSINGHLYEE